MKRLILLIGLAVFACGAQAFPTMTFLGTGTGRNAQISLDGGAHFENVFAGQLNMRVDLSGSSHINISGFCLTPTVHMASGDVNVTITDTNGYPYQNAARVGRIIQDYLPAVQMGPADEATKDIAMAAQVSIWELLAEGNSTYDDAAGSFQARASDGGAFTTNQMNLINAMLGSQDPGLAQVYMAGRDGNGAPTSQDIGTVPEPAAIAILALGMLGLARRKRRS